MTDHQRLQEQLAAYASGRLDPDRAREVERHLVSCEECSFLAEGFREIADGLRRGGAALLAGHPSTSALRAWALGQEAAGDDVARHADTCASCALEAAGWRSLPTVRVEARPKRAVAAWRVPLSLAATLVVGIGLGILSRPAPAPGTPSESGRSAAFAGGPAGLIVLDTPVRGSTIPQSVARISGAPFVVLAVPTAVLPEGPEAAELHVSLATGDGTVLWSVDADARALGRQASSGVASFLVPSGTLTPGPKVFRVSPRSGPPLTEIRFVVEP